MKNIIIPVETKNRELDGKIWLALHLAASGNRVAVGEAGELLSYPDLLEPDWLISVSAGGTPAKIERLKKLQRLGVVTSALDVEGGIFRTNEDYLVRLGPEILRHLDYYFAWGKTPGEIVAEKTDFPQESVVVTGAPKFDLLHSSYRKFYRDKAEEHIEKYGKYFLVNTNFGLVNHYDKQINFELMSRDDISRLKKPERKKFISFQEKLVNNFLEMIDQISDSFPDKQIIVRPHPSENFSTYEQHFKNRDNVTVRHTGNVHHWVLGAEAVIHNNCTTAIESLLLGTPVFAFAPLKNEEYELILPNRISSVVSTIPELLEKLDQSQKQEITSGLKGLAEDEYSLLKSYFHNVDGRGAERVSEFINNTPADAKWDDRKYEFKVNYKERIRRLIDMLFGSAGVNIVRKIWQMITRRSSTSGYARQKFPGAGPKEIEMLVKKMQTLKSEFKSKKFIVKKIKGKPNCFWIEGEN